MIGSGNYNLKEIERILVLSYSCVCKMYKRYLAGEFLNLCSFESAIEKKKGIKKDHSNEKNIIASEIAINFCINLNSLSENLHVCIETTTDSLSTICRIIS
ncbi:hypothetical protein DMUE_4923 [Dictyocoela muelleri]|nr:hypothetical protein DMUE_4923 [Dictyocoela muelleri]